MTSLATLFRKAAELPDMPECYPDTDEINAKFFSPFAGMTEMYALQKGIEAGVDTEHARLAPLLELGAKAIALIEEERALMTEAADELLTAARERLKEGGSA